MHGGIGAGYPGDFVLVVFTAVLIVGLLLLLCLVATVCLLVLLGLATSPRGTALGAILAVVLFASLSAIADNAVGALAAIIGLLFGIAIGRLAWPTAAPFSHRYHPVYRIALVTIGLVGLLAGTGLWAYLLTVGDLDLLLDIGGRHPTEMATIAFVTGLPIVLGLLAVRAGLALNQTDDQPARTTM